MASIAGLATSPASHNCCIQECYHRMLCREELSTIGVAPEGRRSHSAIKYRNGIIIFGGGSKNSFKHFNDLFLFNTETYHWTRLNPWGKRPRARRRAGTCLIGSKVHNNKEII